MRVFTGLSSSLERAILETLAYSDIFDYPLRLEELHRYLTCPAEIIDLPPALARLHGLVEELDDYYFLARRSSIVALRKAREARSRPIFTRALHYGRILGALPFVRMVALTGSLAVCNCDMTADFDYMLIASRGRVWTTRALVLALGRITRVVGDILCPNIILSETALEWPWHDLYSARELCQMIPVSGLDMYECLRAANRWTESLLPNALSSPMSVKQPNWALGIPKMRIMDVLRGPMVDLFEGWEMKRKIARLSQQQGFGEETVFTADVCQGNFHHHRKWTQELYKARLSSLGLETPLWISERSLEVV